MHAIYAARKISNPDNNLQPKAVSNSDSTWSDRQLDSKEASGSDWDSSENAALAETLFPVEDPNDETLTTPAPRRKSSVHFVRDVTIVDIDV